MNNSMEVAKKLYDLAICILQDECPPDPQYYLCRKNETYTDGICEMCWWNCLWGAYTGTIPKWLVLTTQTTMASHNNKSMSGE